ncbi:hypothetical protein VUR80DRAFT_7716 [Thermomyces stellatus]
MDQTLTTQVKTSLASSSFPLLPSQSLLASLLSSTRSPSLPLLVSLAKSNILSSSITAPSLLDPSVPAFPPNLLSAEVKEARLAVDVPLQIVDIEDLSRSRWEQIEELERVERGETKRGRAVVRVENEEEDQERQRATQGAGGGSGAPAESKKAGANATHRVTFQDRAGTRLYGLELVRMQRLAVGLTKIGEKVLIKRGAVVARGTVLLEPETCLFLGGYVEEEERRWATSRLKALREAVGASEPR